MNCDSLTRPPPRFDWMKSSPIREAVSSAALTSCWSTSVISGWPSDVGVVVALLRPHPGVAVGLQLEPHRAGRRTAVAGLHPLVGAEQVLDVVAVLVGDHVGPGERAALRAEPGLELLEEGRGRCRLGVGRAVEGPGVRGGAAAAGVDPAAEEVVRGGAGTSARSGRRRRTSSRRASCRRRRPRSRAAGSPARRSGTPGRSACCPRSAPAGRRRARRRGRERDPPPPPPPPPPSSESRKR